jgi:hypothetical protein
MSDKAQTAAFDKARSAVAKLRTATGTTNEQWANEIGRLSGCHDYNAENFGKDLSDRKAGRTKWLRIARAGVTISLHWETREECEEFCDVMVEAGLMGRRRIGVLPTVANDDGTEVTPFTLIDNDGESAKHYIKAQLRRKDKRVRLEDFDVIPDIWDGLAAQVAKVVHPGNYMYFFWPDDAVHFAAASE